MRLESGGNALEDEDGVAWSASSSHADEDSGSHRERPESAGNVSSLGDFEEKLMADLERDLDAFGA